MLELVINPEDYAMTAPWEQDLAVEEKSSQSRWKAGKEPAVASSGGYQSLRESKRKDVPRELIGVLLLCFLVALLLWFAVDHSPDIRGLAWK